MSRLTCSYNFSFLLGIQKLILSGRVSEAIETTQSLYPGLLDRNPNLFFQLKCRQFIEMVNGCDGEVKPLAHSPTRSARNSPCASPARSHSNSTGSSCSGGSSSSGYHVTSVTTNQELDSVDGMHEVNGVENGADDTVMLPADDVVSNGVCREEGNCSMDVSDDSRLNATSVSVITTATKGEMLFLLFQ